MNSYKMEQDNKYLIVMPAYNEAAKIGKLLENMQPYKSNVLVIDDGSKDQTRQIIDDYGFYYKKMNGIWVYQPV